MHLSQKNKQSSEALNMNMTLSQQINLQYVMMKKFKMMVGQQHIIMDIYSNIKHFDGKKNA